MNAAILIHPTERCEIAVDAADMAPAHPHRIARIRLEPGHKLERWIGRCGVCRAAVRLEGYAVQATPLVWVANEGFRASTRGFDGTTAILDTDGKVHTTRVLSSHEAVSVAKRCGCLGYAVARRVFDGGKPDSKRHTCDSKCTNATGPSCDCKCRGANHGRGC